MYVREEEQVGFREGYNTLDHIYVPNTLVKIYLVRRKRLYCAFIDFKKAFDLINRSKLWCKMLENGLNGDVLNVVYNLYSNAKSCAKVTNCIFRKFESSFGVRQGENLSPLLFSLYLNDLKKSLTANYAGLHTVCEDAEKLSDEYVTVFLKLYILLYADDTAILAESPSELQAALDAMHDYCKTWDLSLKISK